jgi:Bifunctional DNA primase/polymerase, N-terminal
MSVVEKEMPRYQPEQESLVMSNSHMGSANPTLKASTLLESALAYAQLGWLTIPVGSDKKPRDPTTGRLLSDWVNQGSDDPEVLTQRFVNTRPGLGIGILTGAVSGIVAIDVDQKPGKEGVASVARLGQLLGSLPPTLMARTPSGGLHYLFKYPTGLSQSVRNKTSIGKTLLNQSQTCRRPRGRRPDRCGTYTA